jgi:hypothetical protein
MIHTKDFWKVATDLKECYFPNVIHGNTEDKNYHAMKYAVECFNNGCLTYRQLIGRLAKYCDDTTEKIHAIVEKYIISFGGYKYQPKKQKNILELTSTAA